MIIKYIINSYIEYHDITLPLLINSLNISGINNNDIIIYIGGSDYNYTKIEHNITYNYITHNSFDYTALIELSETPIPCDYYFYLHDTCEVESYFKEELLKNINYIDKNIDSIYLTKQHIGICNIGLYKSDILYKFKNELKKLINCTKIKAVDYEGFIFKSTNSTHFLNDNVEWCNFDTVYNGVMRKIENYKHIGVKKYKANWGQSFTNWTNKP